MLNLTLYNNSTINSCPQDGTNCKTDLHSGGAGFESQSEFRPPWLKQFVVLLVFPNLLLKSDHSVTYSLLYMLRVLLTPLSWVLFERLINKYQAVCGTWWTVTVLKNGRHLSISLSRWWQSTPYRCFSFKSHSTVILPSAPRSTKFSSPIPILHTLF